MDESYERVLLSKPEVFVYQIPPLATAKGHKANSWNLAKPNWTLRLRVAAHGQNMAVKLEDDNGKLFANCPVDAHPGSAVEPVTDSSRYFVIRVVHDQTKKQAYLGIGFADRSDSFDFNVALQDFFKEKQTEELIAKEAAKPEPKLDLGFKEGQTITISLGGKGGDRPRPKPANSAGGLGDIKLLPPPPSSSGGGRRGRMVPTETTPAESTSSPGKTNSAPATADSAPKSSDDILSLF